MRPVSSHGSPGLPRCFPTSAPGQLGKGLNDIFINGGCALKRGGPNHPKTYALAEALGIRRVHAVGLLEMLFHFTAQYAPEGDIGRYSDRRIAAAVDWAAGVPRLIDALVATGWVDRHTGARLVLHGWSEHADKVVLQRLTRLGKKPIESNHELSGKLCPQTEIDGIGLRALPEPVPLPEPLPLLPEPPSVAAVRLPRISEYPETAAVIRARDPACDDLFITKLVAKSIQDALSDPEIPPEEVSKITDAIVADAVKESFSTFNGKKSHGTGLLLSRVPQIVRNWCKEPG